MLPDSKSVIMHLSADAVAAETVIAGIDTQQEPGFGYLEIDVITDAASDPEPAVTVLELGETDDLNVEPVLIPRFTGGDEIGPSAGFILPGRSAEGPNLYRFNINLCGRKRHLVVHFEPPNDIVDGLAIVGRLSRAHIGPAMQVESDIAQPGCRLIISG